MIERYRESSGTRLIGKLPLLGLLVLSLTAVSYSVEFAAPEAITDASLQYRLTRNPRGAAAFDSASTLHLTYWAGGDVSNPSTPSFVFYRSWEPGNGWSAETTVDESFSGPDRIGGRQPSLALASDETVWIAWHDHRHSTAGQSWIDNIEIYADRLPPAGSFLNGDIRLTQTTAIHAGDNGYLPRLIPDTLNNQILLGWFDFNFNATTSDLFLGASAVGGDFSAVFDLNTTRLTDESLRGNTPSFAVPDFAVEGSGTRHIVWLNGTASGTDILYAERATGAPGFITPQTLATSVGDFLSPPQIAAAATGDLWITYTDITGAGNGDVLLLRKQSGATNFESPIQVGATSAEEGMITVAVDSTGIAHCVWVEDATERHVRYAQVGPTDTFTSENRQITTTSAQWLRPTIALTTDDIPYIIFEEEIAFNSGRLHFVQPLPPPTATEINWELYN